MQTMNLKVVFVHLGKAPVPHLWLNLNRHLSLFPNIPAVIVIDDETHRKNVPVGVELYVYTREKVFSDLLQKSSHDSNFRRGFWIYSLERLLAVIQYHEFSEESQIIHLESDILLMRNFPWAEFSGLRKTTWNIYNAHRDVAAIMFFPSIEHSRLFAEEMRNELINDLGHTDMTILSAIRKNKPNDYEVLPFINSKVPELFNKKTIEKPNPFQQDTDTNVFKDGVFDSAAIGMWLTGHDPRNNFGKFKIHDLSPIINGDSIVDPSTVLYSLDSDGNLKIKSSGAEEYIYLWNLHIHSKSLNFFGNQWNTELAKFVNLSHDKQSYSRFNLKVLSGMLIQSIAGGTFFQFCYGFLRIHLLRRQLSPLKRYIVRRKRLQQ